MQRGDNLWSGDTFSEPCPVFPMLNEPVIKGHFLWDIEVSLVDKQWNLPL